MKKIICSLLCVLLTKECLGGISRAHFSPKEHIHAQRKIVAYTYKMPKTIQMQESARYIPTEQLVTTILTSTSVAKVTAEIIAEYYGTTKSSQKITSVQQPTKNQNLIAKLLKHIIRN